MTDFLWHAVSEKEKEDIKKEAKSIMDNFSKKLEKIKEKTPEPVIERKECERKETPRTEQTNSEFRKIMFENFRIKDSDSARESKKEQQDSRHAPNKDSNDDFIMGEKKAW